MFSGWVVDGVIVVVPDALLLFFFLPSVEVVVAACLEASVGSCGLRITSREATERCVMGSCRRQGE